MTRIVHSRFFKGKLVRKNEAFDKIVTSVWSYDTKNSILTYGATVYHESKTSWCKKNHVKTAKKRYLENPIVVKLLCEENMEKLRYIAIDNFISTELIFRFGAFCKEERRSIEKVPIPKYFNSLYHPMRTVTPYFVQVPYNPHEIYCSEDAPCMGCQFTNIVSEISVFILTICGIAYVFQ